MSAKATARIEAARDVADRLKSAGNHYDAECILSLCRACSSYQATLSQLHGDNMALRRMVEPYCAPPYPKPRPQRTTVRVDLMEYAARLIQDRDPKLAGLFLRLSEDAAA